MVAVSANQQRLKTLKGRIFCTHLSIGRCFCKAALRRDVFCMRLSCMVHVSACKAPCMFCMHDVCEWSLFLHSSDMSKLGMFDLFAMLERYILYSRIVRGRCKPYLVIAGKERCRHYQWSLPVHATLATDIILEEK